VADACAVDREADERRRVTGADHACVAPRPRRETLGAEMDRLEEVRLAGAVVAGDEDGAC
jgi:hypothetical protein